MKHLGKENKKFTEPSVKILDKVENKRKENFLVRFSQPEFTSICPITSQPDFAHIVIDYVPSKWIVESKSLKLYFQSFRNHQSFHEDVTMLIAKDISKELGLDETFRLVVNNGAKAGQSVFHLHIHLLSGRPLNWPPG